MDLKFRKKISEEEKEAARAHLEERKLESQRSRNAFFEIVGRLLPKNLSAKADELLRYAGREELHVESWVGKVFLVAVQLSIIGTLLAYFLNITNELYTVIVGLAAFTILFSAPYLNLSIKADKRAKEIELMLPSALQLMAGNIRSGMTPDRAIWLAARPEFGALMVEIKKAGAETLGGTPITIAFNNMASRVRSRILERTVHLVNEGIESGGEVGTLLSETAAEIRAMDILRKEMTANIAMYSMFILFASLIGAPFLFAISTFFVEMLTRLTAVTGIDKIASQTTEAGINLLTFNTTLTPEFLLQFSMVVITVTTFFSALLMGLIKYGDEKRGLELAPVFIIVGVIVFFVIKTFITSAFGSVLGL